MTLAFTLSGSIPGLLRRYSPVVALPCADLGDGSVVDSDGWPGVIMDMVDGYALVALRVDRDTRTARLVTFELRELALDLFDPTGRIHAAWWLLAWLHKDECRGDPRLHLLSTVDRRRARLLIQLTGEGRGDARLLREVVLAVCSEVTS